MIATLKTDKALSTVNKITDFTIRAVKWTEIAMKYYQFPGI